MGKCAFTSLVISPLYAPIETQMADLEKYGISCFRVAPNIENVDIVDIEG